MKPSLKNLKVLKMPFLPFLGLWKLFIWSISTFKSAQIHKKSKLRVSKCTYMYQNDRFCTSKISKIHVPYNLNDKKIMKFTHCAANTDDFTTLLPIPYYNGFSCSNICFSRYYLLINSHWRPVRSTKTSDGP